MKFSVMKNAVKAYFNRNWRRQDMMNSGKMPEHAYTSLKKVNSFILTLLFDHKLKN